MQTGRNVSLRDRSAARPVSSQPARLFAHRRAGTGTRTIGFGRWAEVYVPVARPSSAQRVELAAGRAQAGRHTHRRTRSATSPKGELQLLIGDGQATAPSSGRGIVRRSGRHIPRTRSKNGRSSSSKCDTASTVVEKGKRFARRLPRGGDGPERTGVAPLALDDAARFRVLAFGAGGC